MTQCYRGCGTELKFDNAVRSQTGKMIPLEMDGNRHQCPKSDYNQQSTTTVQNPQQTPQVAVTKPETQQTSSSVRNDVWLIPKDDWDKVMSHIANMTIQLEHLSEYYGDLLDHVRTMSRPIDRKEEAKAASEARYDQDKEDGTLNV